MSWRRSAATGWTAPAPDEDGSCWSPARAVSERPDSDRSSARWPADRRRMPTPRPSLVAWGRCVETDGAPPFWPWREVLRALGVTDAGDGRRVGSGPVPRRRRAAGAVLDAAAGDRCWSCSTTSTGPTSRPCSSCATSPTAPPARRCCWWRHCATPSRTAARGCAARPAPCPGRRAAAAGGAGRGRGRPPARRARRVRCHGRRGARRHGGNPFFVREVARAVVDGTWSPEDPPRTVRDAVRARVDRLRRRPAGSSRPPRSSGAGSRSRWWRTCSTSRCRSA